MGDGVDQIKAEARLDYLNKRDKQLTMLEGAMAESEQLNVPSCIGTYMGKKVYVVVVDGEFSDVYSSEVSGD